MDMYIKYADRYPGLDEAPVILLKATQMAANELGDSPRAISLYEEHNKYYPENVPPAEVLYIIGHLYEKDMKDIPKALQTYQLLINSYPEHDLSEAARQMVEALEKTKNSIPQPQPES